MFTWGHWRFWPKWALARATARWTPNGHRDWRRGLGSQNTKTWGLRKFYLVSNKQNNTCDSCSKKSHVYSVYSLCLFQNCLFFPLESFSVPVSFFAFGTRYGAIGLGRHTKKGSAKASCTMRHARWSRWPIEALDSFEEKDNSDVLQPTSNDLPTY